MRSYADRMPVDVPTKLQGRRMQFRNQSVFSVFQVNVYYSPQSGGNKKTIITPWESTSMAHLVGEHILCSIPTERMLDFPSHTSTHCHLLTIYQYPLALAFWVWLALQFCSVFWIFANQKVWLVKLPKSKVAK